MATERRRCKKCQQFGHYAKTCKSKRKAPPQPRMSNVERPIDAAQSAGATVLETPPIIEEETLPDPGGDRTAVGAAEIEAALASGGPDSDDWGAAEEGAPWDDNPEPVVTEPTPAKTEPAGPSPAQVGFKKSVETVLTIWEVSLLKNENHDFRPPQEIKELVAQAWTDCAQALGWLEHANDPRVAVILATGLTAGTYGLGTYYMHEAKKKDKNK